MKLHSVAVATFLLLVAAAPTTTEATKKPAVRQESNNNKKHRRHLKATKASKTTCSEDFPKSGKKKKILSGKKDTEDFLALLKEDDEEEIFTFGPFSVFAKCDSSEVSMVAKINYASSCSEDLHVYGDTDDDGSVDENFPPGTTNSELGPLWDESDIGNDVSDGALLASTGHFIGWDGDSVIGFHDPSDTGFQNAFNGDGTDDVDCFVAGTFNLIEY